MKKLGNWQLENGVAISATAQDEKNPDEAIVVTVATSTAAERIVSAAAE